MEIPLAQEGFPGIFFAEFGSRTQKPRMRRDVSRETSRFLSFGGVGVGKLANKPGVQLGMVLYSAKRAGFGNADVVDRCVKTALEGEK